MEAILQERIRIPFDSDLRDEIEEICIKDFGESESFDIPDAIWNRCMEMPDFAEYRSNAYSNPAQGVIEFANVIWSICKWEASNGL